MYAIHEKIPTIALNSPLICCDIKTQLNEHQFSTVSFECLYQHKPFKSFWLGKIMLRKLSDAFNVLPVIEEDCTACAVWLRCGIKAFSLAPFLFVYVGVGAGLALLWDVHGEAPEGKHPAGHQTLQLCAQNVQIHQGPLWTLSKFATPFI